LLVLLEIGALANVSVECNELLELENSGARVWGNPFYTPARENQHKLSEPFIVNLEA
jgi:hypothetical protein